MTRVYFSGTPDAHDAKRDDAWHWLEIDAEWEEAQREARDARADEFERGLDTA